MTGLLWKKNLFGWLTREFYEWLWLKIKYLPDDQILWRCVFNEHQIKDDGTLKSGFFTGHDISVDIAILTTLEKAGQPRGQEKYWIRKPGLAEFQAKVVRSLSHINNKEIDVEHDPYNESEPKNYAHSIFTKRLSKVESRSLIRQLKFPAGKTPVY